MSDHWEHFPHDADMGIRGIAATEAAAFEQAAIAMTALVTDPRAITAERMITLECEAPDHELLLVDWLNALLYEMSTRSMLFSRFAVRLEGNRLLGQAWGEVLDRNRHQPAVEIKGVTYTALRVDCTDHQWVAQTVVDV